MGQAARAPATGVIVQFSNRSTSISCVSRFVALYARVSSRAGYSPTGQRSLHTSVVGGPGGADGSGILLDDERDSAGQHQSATAAAVAAAAAVRKTCLSGSHASAPWRPQGKLWSRFAAAAGVFFSRRIYVGYLYNCRARSVLFLKYVAVTGSQYYSYIVDKRCCRAVGNRIRLEFTRCQSLYENITV